ncbi:MAG: magnesium/cobalt transporter CorA [Anaerolineae bacterium]
MTPQFVGLQNDPAAAPGVEYDEIAALPSTPGQVLVTCVDYCPGQVVEQQIDDLASFLDCHRPEWVTVRWINVDGLSDMDVVHALATKYELHPLAIEDLLDLSDRPKVEPYGGEDTALRARLFIVARTLELAAGRLASRQISLFLGHNTVLTFRETPSDVWDHARQRLRTKGSRLRNHDASFLVYSLLDAIVDGTFPILEHYGSEMAQIEAKLLDGPQRAVRARIDEIKQDLLLLRWVMWPMREMVALLQREPHECISDDTRVYLRDLHDHVVQIIEINEIYRERAGDLSDSYMSAVSYRMNQVMKVLTIIGTIFIPLTFLAGVYGMNFRHMPELDQTWAYPLFWLISLVVVIGMLTLFKRKEWL